MIKLTNEQIGELVSMACANFPHMQEKELGPTVALWKGMLDDLPYPLAKNALFKVLSTAKYWPNVAEIREAALSLTGNTPPLPAEAWAIAREASMARSFDTTTLHPAVQKAIRGMGGLEAMGLDESPLGMRQARFLKLYEPVAVYEQGQGVLPQSVRAFISGAEVKRLA